MSFIVGDKRKHKPLPPLPTKRRAIENTTDTKRKKEWSDGLPFEVKDYIFKIFYEIYGLLPFLELRKVDHEANSLVKTRFLLTFNVELCPNITRLGTERLGLYHKSDFKSLFNYILQKPFSMIDHNQETQPSDDSEFSEYEKKYCQENPDAQSEDIQESWEIEKVNENLTKLTATYASPCKKFEINSFTFMESYDAHLGNSEPFKPTVLQCFFLSHSVLSKDTSTSNTNRIAYYKKLKPFLTQDLQKLTIRIAPKIFRIITNPESELALELLTPTQSRLGNLLFEKTLNSLSILEIDINNFNLLKRTQKISLDSGDMLSLNQFTPNLRHLTLANFFLSSSFLKKLLKSPLLAQLKTLNFNDCLFDSKDLANFFKTSCMPNLKYLGLPSFYCAKKENAEITDSIILQLSENTSLKNLKTISFSTQFLRQQNIISLLLALATNTSLTKLRAIRGIKTDPEKKIPLAIQSFLKSLATFKNFNWSCLENYFGHCSNIKSFNERTPYLNESFPDYDENCSFRIEFPKKHLYEVFSSEDLEDSSFDKGSSEEER